MVIVDSFRENLSVWLFSMEIRKIIHREFLSCQKAESSEDTREQRYSK